MNEDLISRSALLEQECFMDDDNGFRCSVVFSDYMFYMMFGAARGVCPSFWLDQHRFCKGDIYEK